MKQFINVLCVFFVGLFISSAAMAAETAITPITPSETVSESVFTTADPTNGNSVQNPGGDVILVVRNSHASASATFTLTVQDSTVTYPGVGQVTKSSLTCSLDAGEECILGPFAPIFWNDGNSNLIMAVSGSGSGSVEIAPIKP